MFRMVVVWADGSSCKDPGCGGWATILVAKDAGLVMIGQRECASHNEIEAMAVLEGLRKLTVPCLVTLFTDSTYVIDGLAAITQGRLFETHLDIWEQMREHYQRHLAVRVEHVAAHKSSTAPLHRYCDRLSKKASHRQIPEKQYYIDLSDLLNEAKT